MCSRHVPRPALAGPGSVVELFCRLRRSAMKSRFTSHCALLISAASDERSHCLYRLSHFIERGVAVRVRSTVVRLLLTPAAGLAGLE